VTAVILAAGTAPGSAVDGCPAQMLIPVGRPSILQRTIENFSRAHRGILIVTGTDRTRSRFPPPRFHGISSGSSSHSLRVHQQIYSLWLALQKIDSVPHPP